MMAFRLYDDNSATCGKTPVANAEPPRGTKILLNPSNKTLPNRHNQPNQPQPNKCTCEVKREVLRISLVYRRQHVDQIAESRDLVEI